MLACAHAGYAASPQDAPTWINSPFFSAQMPSQWPDDLDLAGGEAGAGVGASFAIPPALGDESAAASGHHGEDAAGGGASAGKSTASPGASKSPAVAQGDPRRGRKAFGRSMSTSQLGALSGCASPSLAAGYRSESEKSDTSQANKSDASLSGTESEDGSEGGEATGGCVEDGGAAASRAAQKKKRARERKKAAAAKKKSVAAKAFVERTVGSVSPKLKR